MNKYFVFSILFFGFSISCFGQFTKEENIKVATLKDTSSSHFSPGLYVTVPAFNKEEKGFKLFNTDEEYYIGTEYGVTLRHLDTVYKEFDKNYKGYLLIFQFDSTGAKELLDFSRRYQGEKIGFLINNDLIWVATIPMAIFSGNMSLDGKLTEAEVDKLKIEIERAARRLKEQRGTNR